MSTEATLKDRVMDTLKKRPAGYTKAKLMSELNLGNPELEESRKHLYRLTDALVSLGKDDYVKREKVGENWYFSLKS